MTSPVTLHSTSKAVSSTLHANAANLIGSPLPRSPLSRPSREDAMRILDEKIRKLLEDDEGSDNLDVVLLKRQRNSHAPISQLPAEILTDIFLYFQNQLEHEEDELKCVEITYEVIRITHVCYQWREVAVGYPGLWNHIESGSHTNPGLMQCFLERSKKMLLDARHEFCACDTHHKRSLDNLGLLTDRLSRVIDLDILGHMGQSWPLINVALRKPAPKLQNFAVQVSQYSRLHAQSSQHDEFSEIDSNLFGGYAPELRNLIIINIKISFQNPISPAILRNLRVLQLTGNPGNTSIPDLLVFIRNSQQLEDLRFAQLFSEEFDEIEFSRCATVHLPYLRWFFLEANIYAISFLLGKLEIPQDIYWRITCVQYPLMDPNYNEIPAIINSLAPCEEIRIVIYNSRIAIERDFKNHSRDYLAPHFVYDLQHIDWESNPISASRVFNLLSESIMDRSWSHAETLRLHIMCDEDFVSEIDSECWFTLLESMPNLFFLEIFCHCEPDCLKILLKNIIDSNLNADANLYTLSDQVSIVIGSGRRFPSLTQIHITKYKVGDVRATWERQLYFCDDRDEDKDLLLDCLMEQGFLKVDERNEDTEEEEEEEEDEDEIEHSIQECIDDL